MRVGHCQAYITKARHSILLSRAFFGLIFRMVCYEKRIGYGI